jgi:Spy/CpxP family protein refolding chaperone
MKEKSMKVVKAIHAAISIASLVCGLGAHAQAPAPGSGPGFGFHRPPLERSLGPGPGGRWWNDQAMVDKLGLSEDQRKNMDDILLQHRERLIDLRATLEKSELDLEPLMGADTPNESQILAQIDKVAQARAELEKANARFLLAIRAKLTPDQYRQLQAAHAEHRQMRHGLSPDAVRPHHLQPPAGPDGPGTPPPSPGPQGMTPHGPDPDFAPGPPPSAEAGAIE